MDNLWISMVIYLQRWFPGSSFLIRIWGAFTKGITPDPHPKWADITEDAEETWRVPGVFLRKDSLKEVTGDLPWWIAASWMNGSSTSMVLLTSKYLPNRTGRGSPWSTTSRVGWKYQADFKCCDKVMQNLCKTCAPGVQVIVFLVGT